MKATHSRLLSRGFTLVEMMVVVVVMAIILAVAAPSFGDMLARYRVRGVAAELASSIELARSESLARGNIQTFFGSNGTMSCYTIAETTNKSCTCTAAAGQAVCPNRAREILTVRVPASSTVSVTPHLAEGQEWGAEDGTRSFQFIKPTFQTLPQLADIEVSSSRSGRIKLMFNALGRISTCTPDGSISGVPRCP